MHQRPSNSVAKPESGPEYSVPATGCAGISVDAVSGRCSVNAVRHRALHGPDVADDRASRDVRCDRAARSAAIAANRHADDDADRTRRPRP